MQAQKLPPIFQLFIDAGTRARDAVRRRHARRARVVHGLDGRRPQGRRARRRAARQDRCSSSAATTPSSSMRRANLDLAVPAIVFGAVGTAGQRCTTTRRVFVHDSRRRSSRSASSHAYRQVRIGDPLESGTLMGPLIDARAVEGYRGRARQRRARAGGEVLCGGKRAASVRATSSSRRSCARRTTGRSCRRRRSRRSST